MGAAAGWADGLSTSFADVMVTGVPAGTSYSLKSAQRGGYRLRNLGDRPVHVRIEARVPQPAELRGGTEPIGNREWVTIQPSTFELGPRQEIECDVIIQVPKTSRYRGRLFQAMIFSKGSASGGDPGIRLGTGLLSRLRFKVGD
jgi:hypothetical protein